MPLLALYVTIAVMIQSFRDERTRQVFRRERVKSFTLPLQRAALRKLLMIDAAMQIQDLRIPPGNRLEKLVGDRQGQYSIRINDQWRVCFRWLSGNAQDVEIVDYH